MQIAESGFQNYLCHKEKILWCGEYKSGGGINADRKIAFTSNLWAIPFFLLFIVVAELTAPFSLLYRMISITASFVLIACLFAVNIVLNISARGSIYAITDKQIIIIDGTNGKKYSAMLWEISGITVKEGRNNIGCIRYMVNGEYKIESKSKWTEFTGKGYKTDYYGLYGIENPQEVCKILRNAIYKNQ